MKANMMYYHIYLYHGNKYNYYCVITQTLQNGQTLGQFFELLYFIKGSRRFRSNKSNWEAWCCSCINKKVRAAHRAQLDDTERTEEVDAVEDLEAHCE